MPTEPDYWGEKAARLLMTLEDWDGVYDTPAEVLKAQPNDLARLALALRAAYVDGASKETELRRLVREHVDAWRLYFTETGGEPERLFPSFKALAEAINSDHEATA